ncbi:MAG: MBL fold metallo-hydrolase [Promethearchaeota archaeon]
MKIELNPEIKDKIFWYSKDKPVKHVLFRGFSSNVFILHHPSSGELWQIDAGTYPLGRPQRTIKWMRKDGLNPSKITKIFITHAHGDHTTGLKYFKKEAIDKVFRHGEDNANTESNGYNGPLLYIHKKDAKGLELSIKDFIRRELTIAEEYGFKMFSKIPLSILAFLSNYSLGKHPQISADVVLDDNQIIKGDDFDLKVIHTPGHTPGHVCYYVPQLKALFVGDLIDPEFNSKPPVNLPSSSYTDFYNSIKKILELEVEIFLMPHAKRIYFGAEENRKLILKALNNLEYAKKRTIELLEGASKKGLRLKDFDKKYPKSIWNEKQEQMTIALSIIKELIREGRVTKETSSKGVYFKLVN